MRPRLALALLALCPLLFACESRVGSYASLVTGTTAGAGLTGLALSDGTLSPPFSSGTTSYSASVPNAVSSITVTARAGAGASVTVNGQAVASGAASAPIPLAVGSNVVNIGVRGADGTTRSYVVSVTRATT